MILRMPTRLAAMTLWACLICFGNSARSATITELAALARESTFEVVLPKFEPSFVKYEMPLPLELLPFAERNDKFLSIGTAFAIAPDVFVSNAHVLMAGIGSPLGKPHLRDEAGKAWRIDRVIKFSLHEDFVVFKASGATASRPLAPAEAAIVGAKVYAVGNALGEGVVLRDGLLTSMTPEDQDGRWKWLRFSAAASPGNSGGPLLDEEGRVIGVVTARSPGENLNYGLPIERVIQGSEKHASMDMRGSFRLPILRQQMVSRFNATFPLPATWEDFTVHLQKANDKQHLEDQAALLEKHSAALPPRGRTADLLSTLQRNTYLGLIAQQADDNWGVSSAEQQEDIRLDEGGTLRMGSLPEAGTFAWMREGTDPGRSVHRDATLFMDTLLKGLRLPRMVGSQSIRITSLGAPASDSQFKDRFGRTWQLRDWSLGYMDIHVLVLALPTPSGYSGLLRMTDGIRRQNTVEALRLMADYMHVNYSGTAAEWQAFVAEKDLCPPWLRGLRFDMKSGVAVRLIGADVSVPSTILELDEESTLAIFMQYRASPDGKLQAAPFGINVWEDARGEKSSIGIYGQVEPDAMADREIRDRWRNMKSGQGEFSGVPRRDPDGEDFWALTAAGDGSQKVMYEIYLSLNKPGLLPRHVSDRLSTLTRGLQFRDAGETP